MGDELNLQERVKWVEYNGKEILFTDYSNLKGQDMIDVTQEYERIIQESGKDLILQLLDFTGATMTKESADLAKKNEEQEKEKGITKHAACIGVTGLKRAIAKVVKPDMFYANSLEDAKDWLITQ
jgi:hypothetical protein